MKVSSVSSVNNFQTLSNRPSFSGNYYEKITKVIPNTKVCKNLRNLDRMALYSYVNSRSYKIGITADEVAELEKFDGVDFIQKSYEFLINKMGLKKSVCPPLASAKFKEFDMGYSFLENVIYVDVDKVNKLGKGPLFSALRHEMQHMNQNYMVLRHEKYGPLAIEAFTKQYIAENKKVLNELVEKHSLDELENKYSKGEDSSSKIILELVKAMKAGDTDRYNQVFDLVGETYKQSLMSLREKIINYFGIIKNDSELTSKVEGFFKDFSDIGYYNPDGKIDYNKYFASEVEDDAISAQVRAQFEFSKEPCFMKFIKPEILKAMQDNRFLNIIDSMK